jgi:hypothetical protein
MGHRFDAGLLLDLFRDLDRLAPGAAARSVGDGNERGSEVVELLDGFEEGGHSRVVLRREKLEREERVPSPEQIPDLHRLEDIGAPPGCQRMPASHKEEGWRAAIG